MGKSKLREIGDVSIWFDTEDSTDSQVDADLFIQFFNDADDLIGWLEVYERSDMQAFESGMLNYADIGNPATAPWLVQLKDEVTKMTIEIARISDEEPEWLPNHVALDFCQDEENNNSLVCLWRIGEWIREDERYEFLIHERFEGDIRKRFSQHAWRTVDAHSGGAEETPGN